MSENNDEVSLALGSIVVANEEGDAFARIQKQVHKSDKERYDVPDKKQISKTIRLNDSLLKMICAINFRDVLEADRLCTFKLYAISVDNKQTARICTGTGRKFCRDHSCQADPKLKELHQYTKSDGLRASKLLGGGNNTIKKRKKAALEDRLKAAWKILNSKKMFPRNQYAEAMTYIKQLGVFEAIDLLELEEGHINRLERFMKELAGKKWAEVVNAILADHSKLVNYVHPPRPKKPKII